MRSTPALAMIIAAAAAEDAPAPSGWVEQDVGATSPRTARLSSVFAADDLNVWAVGSAKGGDGGTAMRTSDGGASWVGLELPAGTGPLSAIWGTVAKDGSQQLWAAGGRFSGGCIVRSTDAGGTWELQAVPENAAQLVGVWGANASTLWAVGETQSIAPLVLRTDNGGKDWARQEFKPKTCKSYPAKGCVRGIQALWGRNGSNIFVAGQDSVGGWPAIGNTTDGGETWEALERTPARMNGNIAAIWGLGNDIWVGGAGGLTTLLWHSADGGQTFIDQGVPSSVVGISGIFGVSASRVFAVGRAEGDSGLILSTSDGGEHWDAEPVPETTTNLRAMHGAAAAGGDGIELWTVGDSGSVHASILHAKHSYSSAAVVPGSVVKTGAKTDDTHQLGPTTTSSGAG